MISLVDVSRTIRIEKRRRALFSGINASFPTGSRVGILAPAGSGKSTLARLICGIEQPDKGYVISEGKVSWPMGFAGGFHPDLSLGKNIALLGMVLGEPPALLAEFCGAFGNLEDAMHQPAKMLSPTERLAAAFSLSLAVPCDTYVADESIGFGDGIVRRKSEAMLAKRLENAGLIFLSRNPAQLAKYCDQFWVLLAGQLKPCRTPEIGMQALNLLAEQDNVTAQDFAKNVPETDANLSSEGLHDIRI